ncbi:DUF5753 domain-containing protein, partial [Streptomyces sp. TRM76130]|nr:DUF5753 domain-containing protein [Streptomyces sp. TRM76130]
MQTKEYAYALLGCQESLTREQVEERVNARLSRQNRLNAAQPPLRWAIIEESVLRRKVGTEECMYKQLA